MKPDQTKSRDVLLSMTDIHIEGYSDDKWHQIVKGVSLELRRGEVLGLIGESGAEITLGLAAMGFTAADHSGQISFDGQNLLSLSEAERRALRGGRIAYVAQSAAASFNPAHRLLDQTIEATLRSTDSSAADAHKDAVQLYDTLQLPSPQTIGDRFTHQVSGGQLQRVMTAMAMSTPLI